MNRLALLLLASSLVSGCIFATPPTGLRLGDHSQEFAHLQNSQPTATQINFKIHQAADFKLIYPDFWSLGKADVALTEKVTSRIAAGRSATSGEAEGVTVVEINDPLDPDPAKATEALGQFVKASLAQSYPQNFELVSETAAKLGGQDGLSFEAKGSDANGLAHHVLSQAAMYEGKGFVVTVSTVENLFSTYRPLYDHILKNFTFGDAPAPDATASGEATATGEVTASPETTATPAQQ